MSVRAITINALSASLRLLFLLVLSGFLFFSEANAVFAGATEDFQAAKGAFNAGDYGRAISLLEANLKGPDQVYPSDSLYYLALSFYKIGDLDRAQKVFLVLQDKCKGTAASGYAAQYLAIIAGDRQRERASDVVPRETWVSFRKVGRHAVVDGELAGKSARMIFDTGAELCYISTGELARLGLPAPTGAPNTQGGGVGQGGLIPMWFVKYPVTVGRIVKQRVPLIVGPGPASPMLLGQSFFNDLKYSIESAGQTIVFSRKENVAKGAAPAVAGNQTASAAPVKAALSVDATGRYVYTVPFKRVGNALVVTVALNGKDCEMILDTGAELTCMTPQIASKYNIALDPRRRLRVGGVSGVSMASMGVISKAKLGPIERSDLLTAVTPDVACPYPLLGHDFFNRWQYTVDNEKGVISFARGSLSD